MRFFKVAGLLAALILLSASVLSAQDKRRVIIDPPRPVPPPARAWQDYKLEKIGLEVIIEGQKASCTLRYVIYNPGSSPIEVDFLAPLPEGGTVTGLSLFDGRNEMAGQVYNKEEAWSIYREIVSKLKDPALLEYAGRDTFRARVFPVPPKGRQTLELNFDFLAPRNEGQTGFSFPLAGPMTSGRVLDQDIQVIIRQAAGLSGIYSPLEGVEIEHVAGNEAKVTFSRKNTGALDKFQLYFQADSGPMGGLVLSHKPDKDDDGYFLFLAEPNLDLAEASLPAKNVIFVLDKSGSMSGQKFKQAKEALNFILDRLDEKDNFNLVDYNARVYSWQPELMDMSRENRGSAKAYVENLRSGGNTNIEESLTTAFGLLKNSIGEPSYIIFLTDGQATTGETNEMKLAEIAKKSNAQDAARLFSFGVGHDVNSRLLDRLSGQAGGSSIFVDPGENLEAKVSSFFSRITTPALTRPNLKADKALNRQLPEKLPDFFTGQQVVVVGRYPRGGETTFTLSGRQGDKDFNNEYKVVLADGPALDGQFIASLWAQRRIGELIDEIDLGGGRPSPELVDELVGLSKKFGILTPYTSFLALEDQAITRQSELAPMVAENLSIMQDTVGDQANRQRAFKWQMKDMGVDASGPGLRQSMPATEGAAAGSFYSPDMEMAALDLQVAKSKSAGRNLSRPNQWAGQTFFLKNGQWQAANLSDDDLKNTVTIKQLSKEYFELAKKLKAEEMVWLTQPEPVVFKYEGVNYLIEPEA